MKSVEAILENLNIDSKKRIEIERKPQLKQNLEIVFKRHNSENKLLYTLACTVPKKMNLLLLSDLVHDNTIAHEGMLKGVYKFLEKNSSASYDEVRLYINENNKSGNEIIRLIKDYSTKSSSKGDLLSKLKKDLPLADFKFVLSEVNKLDDSIFVSNLREDSKDWLDEGEVSKLHKPGENPQLSEVILQNHLKRTGGKVVTRFPPEPNGILHIGHAKAANLNWGYANKFGGYTYLRFDDTNPRNEDDYYFNSIIEDVEWLGFKPYKITASSDYFEKMIEFGYKLIKNGDAYICECDVEDMRRRRREFQDLRDADPNKNFDEVLSPYRNRPISENLRLFEEMVDKKHNEGSMTLRFKMNTSSRNPMMYDLVGMRIIDSDHVKTGGKYNLYPSYEFALCVSDSLEDVTHSFCSREFFTRQESYNWLLDKLEIYKPVQWEFSRLNISNTVLSKRKLVPLSKYGIELDDPRLYTIKGMRRRGIPPKAINDFVKSLGITYSETIIDTKIFDSFIRNELNCKARRIMCVKEPLKILIRNAEPCKIEAPDFPNSETKREIDFTPEIFIEKDDFMIEASKDFLRFSPSQPVGLYLYGAIKFVEMKEDVVIAEKCDEVPKKYIHWVSVNCTKVELRFYSHLFKSYNPNEGNFLEDLNLDSKHVTEGYCDKRIKCCKIEESFQFQRIGYFCVDPDSKTDSIVLNLTITLK